MCITFPFYIFLFIDGFAFIMKTLIMLMGEIWCAVLERVCRSGTSQQGLLLVLNHEISINFSFRWGTLTGVLYWLALLACSNSEQIWPILLGIYSTIMNWHFPIFLKYLLFFVFNNAFILRTMFLWELLCLIQNSLYYSCLV